MAARQSSGCQSGLRWGDLLNERRRVATVIVAAALTVAGWPEGNAKAAEGSLPRMQLTQGSSGQSPRIAVLSTVIAEPSSEMPLQIRVAPTESIPRNSFLRLRGLPPTASLSEGYSIAPGAWAVPLNGLPRLTLSLPSSVSGKS